MPTAAFFSLDDMLSRIREPVASLIGCARLDFLSSFSDFGVKKCCCGCAALREWLPPKQGQVFNSPGSDQGVPV